MLWDGSDALLDMFGAKTGNGNSPPLTRESRGQAAGATWPAYCCGSLRVMFLDVWYLSLLYICVPFAVGIDSKGSKSSSDEMLVFALSCAALVPLSERLSFIVEQLSLHVGDIIAGLLNVTFGNTPELIVVITCVSKGKADVAADALNGSMLSSLMLVCGLGFFVGGLRHHTLTYSTQLSSALLVAMLLFALTISCISSMPAQQILPVPGPTLPALRRGAPAPKDKHVYRVSAFLPDDEEAPVLAVSRLASVMAMLFYLAFVFFMLVTHRHILDEGDVRMALDEDLYRPAQHARADVGTEAADGGSGDRGAGGGDGAAAAGTAAGAGAGGTADADRAEDVLGLWGSIAWLVVVVGLIAVLADAAIDAIDGAAEVSGLTRLFLCGVVLPSVNNAPEVAVALKFALKNRFNLVIAAEVGSAAQVGLFLLPLTVFADWADGGDLNLAFPEVQHVSLFVGVLVTVLTLQSGRATWLHGLCLVLAYLVIASCWFFKPCDLYVEPTDNSPPSMPPQVRKSSLMQLLSAHPGHGNSPWSVVSRSATEAGPGARSLMPSDT